MTNKLSFNKSACLYNLNFKYYNNIMNRHTIFNQGKYGSFHFTMDMQSGSSEQILRAETVHASDTIVSAPSHLYLQEL